MNSLKAESDYVADYDDLPSEPLEHLKDIDEDLGSLKLQRNKLEDRKEQLEDTVSSYTQQDEVILENATDIKLAVGSCDRVKADRG